MKTKTSPSTSASSASRAICVSITTIKRDGVLNVTIVPTPLEWLKAQLESKELKKRTWTKSAKNVDHGLCTFTTKKILLSQAKTPILDVYSVTPYLEAPSNQALKFKNS